MPSPSCSPILKALSDETRWRIVQSLLARPQTVGELVARLGATQYNVSKHLKVLRGAGILEQERDGKYVRSRVGEAFRSQLAQDAKVLDLGCCTFRFDQRPARSQQPRPTTGGRKPKASAA